MRDAAAAALTEFGRNAAQSGITARPGLTARPGPLGPDSPLAGPVALPADPNALAAGPDSLLGPVTLPVGPVTVPAGADSRDAGPNALPAGPDLLVPCPAVLVDPMVKLLTLPVLLLLVPVPPPVDVLAAPNCVVVVVEWRVIVVADSCIGPTPSGAALCDEKALPGAFGPWCVFASAVPAAAKAIYTVAAVIVPVINTVRVHDRCCMLCLPTMMPLCNKRLEYAQFLERLFTFRSDISPLLYEKIV